MTADDDLKEEVQFQDSSLSFNDWLCEQVVGVLLPPHEGLVTQTEELRKAKQNKETTTVESLKTAKFFNHVRQITRVETTKTKSGVRKKNINKIFTTQKKNIETTKELAEENPLFLMQL